MIFQSELISLVLLAIIQGVTEWLPISSSGHLVLFGKILDFSGGGLFFEVALHFGTLMAVFVYFGRDIVDILQDFVKGKWQTENGRLAILILLASVPAGLVGFFAAKIFDSLLSNLAILALGFAITGVLLLITSFAPASKKEKNPGYFQALIVGVAQAVAIVPGISRAGATISSGVLLGLSEKAAMRFSFLMSIPVIFGASILTLGSQPLPKEFIWAALVSFVVGLLTIHILFKYILVKRKNFGWFGAYCLLLSASIFCYLAFF